MSKLPVQSMASISQVQFRTSVTSGDAAAVEAIVRAAGVFSEAEIAIARELVEDNLARGSIASGYHFLFADGADGLDGYTAFGPIPGTDRRYELYWISVRKEAQRAKLAARLLKASEDEVQNMGGVMMIAETSTRPDYAPANEFYRAQGYTLLADIPDWHADGDGLAIFGKRLS
jgi:ribosomal protein S18 acetylase RimI-like enzyme